MKITSLFLAIFNQCLKVAVTDSHFTYKGCFYYAKTQLRHLYFRIYKIRLYSF